MKREKWEKALVLVLTLFIIYDFLVTYRDYRELEAKEERAISMGDYDLAEEYHYMASERMEGFFITFFLYLILVSPLAYDLRRKKAKS